MPSTVSVSASTRARSSASWNANGAGKTTTFYMIVGIERPTSGKITIDGKDITNLPIHKRAAYGIGYLPQEASIFRKLTVEDNLLAMLETTKLSKKEQR